MISIGHTSEAKARIGCALDGPAEAELFQIFVKWPVTE